MANKEGHRGLGSIRKLPSGRYQLRYTDPSGISKSAGTYSTKSAAEQELNRIQSAIERGTYYQALSVLEGALNPKTVTLGELAQHWRSTRVNKNGEPLAAKTALEYARLIDRVLSPLRDKAVRSITTAHIEKWWRDPKNADAPRQRNAAYKHLSTLMAYAAHPARRIISVNPCIIENATSYTPSRKPQAPDDKQVEIMLTEAREPFKAILALAAWGGLRKGEILALTRGDVEVNKTPDGIEMLVSVSKALTWANDTTTVKTPKTAGSIRTVPLPPRVHSILTEHLATIPIHSTALLFPRTHGTDELPGEFQWNFEWKRVRSTAGFAGRFHSLRSFALTRYAHAGATVEELMARAGHKDIKTAMRYQQLTGRDRELTKRLG